MRWLSKLFPDQTKIGPDQTDKKLGRISKILGIPALNGADPVSVMMNMDHDEYHRATDEFFTLCESDDATRALREQFRVARPDLENIYRTIIEVGGGQWRGGHYVPVSALANPRTLHYILQTITNDENDEDTLREMVFNLLMYFQNDRTSMYFSKTKEDYLLD